MRPFGLYRLCATEVHYTYQRAQLDEERRVGVLILASVYDMGGEPWTFL